MSTIQRALTQAEQELCNTMDGLVDTLSKQFNAKHNKMIKSLHHHGNSQVCLILLILALFSSIFIQI